MDDIGNVMTAFIIIFLFILGGSMALKDTSDQHDEQAQQIIKRTPELTDMYNGYMSNNHLSGNELDSLLKEEQLIRSKK